MDYQAEFDALNGEDQKLAPARSVALHLAFVYGHQLIGAAALHPQMRPLAQKVLETARLLNGEVAIGETMRTFARQDRLYAQGRTAPGPIVTKAWAGQSYHNYGLAFDIRIVALPPGDTTESFLAHIGTTAEREGMVWGGDFGDDLHFEYHPGFTWEDLIAHFTLDHA